MSNVEIAETGGHPAVLGEWLGAPAGAPTVLVYGHYDVQPPDPLDEWTTPPFEPTVRDGRLYARGASDDKGPMLIPILVAEAFLQATGRLPVNLKFLIEGEEEVGSAHSADRSSRRMPTASRRPGRLGGRRHVARRPADRHRRQPGHLRARVHASTAPARICTPAGMAAARRTRSMRSPRLVASLHDADGRVAVAGFHDGILPPDPALRDAIRVVAMDVDGYYASIGARRPAWAHRRGQRCSSANGSSRRWSSTAFGAAIAARARKP